MGSARTIKKPRRAGGVWEAERAGLVVQLEGVKPEGGEGGHDGDRGQGDEEKGAHACTNFLSARMFLRSPSTVTRRL